MDIDSFSLCKQALSYMDEESLAETKYSNKYNGIDEGPLGEYANPKRSATMIGENRQLVTNEPVESENNRLR